MSRDRVTAVGASRGGLHAVRESPDGPATILLVDDRGDNLLALEAILQPLGQRLVSVTSGTDALRELLESEVAVILLDVQMPGIDGFETAALIKQRERTRHIPIIFLTAISKDAEHVFRGYAAGAVDYVLKPFDASVLRSKVAVFIELWQKRRQVEEQAEQLRKSELAEVARAGEERYRFLAESIPQQVWTARPDGALDYVNQRVLDYLGREREELLGWAWTDAIHPDDRPTFVPRWRASLESGRPFEAEFRLRRGEDGEYRWHLGRAVPFVDAEGAVARWFGTNTDMDDRKRIEEQRRFLLDASAELGSSLDYERTLAAVADLAVPRVADWCIVGLRENGDLRAVAERRRDSGKPEAARALVTPAEARRAGTRSLADIARKGKAELVPEVPRSPAAGAGVDSRHARELGVRSWIGVPLVSRGRVLGAIGLGLTEFGRSYGSDELALAEELARRAAAAVDMAQLYHAAEKRAQAAKVLDTVADGVFLVDRRRVIRLWNTGAHAITGLAPEDVVGRVADEVIPGWAALAPLVPVRTSAAGASRTETVPLELAGREIWLSIAGVGFDEGTVYAFRDVTEQRAVERMKADFVATVSHELRTPLAGIYGAALTLRRPGLDETMRERLLEVVAGESERLADTVNDVLLASHLDSGRLKLSPEPCDVAEIASSVAESARLHAPRNVELEMAASTGVPPVLADANHLRRVFANLVDNAMKYSPDGGRVRIEISGSGPHVRVVVRDEGLGIPLGEKDRIFEKFYRLDAQMTRGIGGTGLGLYICRELVRRFDGRIWAESNNGKGSAFVVEIPISRQHVVEGVVSDRDRPRERRRTRAGRRRRDPRSTP